MLVLTQTLLPAQRAAAATSHEDLVNRCIALASRLDDAGERLTFLRDQAMSGPCAIAGRWHVRVPARVVKNGENDGVEFAAVLNDDANSQPLFYARLNDATLSQFSNIIESSGEAGY